MKKVLVLLALSILLACSMEDDEAPPSFNATGGETMADGLEWYEVVEYFYVVDTMSGGTSARVNPDYIESDSNDGDGIVAMIEFDDDKDYVGIDRAKLKDGDQLYIYSFNLDIKQGYTFKLTKGDITDEQFRQAVNRYGQEDEFNGAIYWEGLADYENYVFYFYDITGHEDIEIGTVLAEIEVYKTDDMDKPLGEFFIVL